MSENSNDAPKTIYDLDLHESMRLHKWIFILRVPGGWIYEIEGGEYTNTSAFVPFHTEFQQDA